MPAFRLSLLGIVSAFFMILCNPLSAQPVKTLATMNIHGDLDLSGSGGSIVFPDGSVQPSAGITYARTVVVSPAGTPAQNGAALRVGPRRHHRRHGKYPGPGKDRARCLRS